MLTFDPIWFEDNFIQRIFESWLQKIGNVNGFAFVLNSTAVCVCYGRQWPAVYINFVLKIHQIQVLTEPLCRAQASFYALPNNERGTKYRGLTYSARQNCP